jgi:peptide/nickel transport system ATP-binding protein
MKRMLLEAQNLSKSYGARGLRDRGTSIRAVDDVSIGLQSGMVHGMVGESGAGKSTLVRLLLALERPDRGAVRFDGVDITSVPAARLRPLRRRFQAVFQDPYTSLNPHLKVGTIVAEPLAAHAIARGPERQELVGRLLEAVGLPAAAATRRPAAFSGGERQRIAIARALATSPDLVVLDEPLSALDLPAQVRLIELLLRLRSERNLTLLVVAHDLAVVRSLCDTVSVMYAGRMVEEGPVTQVLVSPLHPFTAQLLAAEPMADAHAPLPRPTSGPPDGSWPPGACRLFPRCPLASEICLQEPDLQETIPGRRVACWHPGHEDMVTDRGR